jgi:lysozyme family protein
MTETLAGKIVRAMERQGHALDNGPGEVNIVYVEGINPDGTANDNSPNAFKDLRAVISFVDGAPRIVKAWECTTAPGRHYTENPLKAAGAAIIALGHQRCWKVGTHRAGSPNAHEALVQTGAEVVVHRDRNADYQRAGDVTDKGWFGINQHWGYDQPVDDIGYASAGCLVGRTREGHREFMRIVKSDPRYLADPDFVFGTTVLTAADVLQGATAAPVPTTTVSAAERQRMAKAIVDFEARRDEQGRLAVYEIPSGDGGGAYEVAGINQRYHPREAARLKGLIEQGRHAEAEQAARDYVLAYTDVVAGWAQLGAGVEFYLRDCAFNRGPTGSAAILQRAVGADEDGIVGKKTRTATAANTAEALLTKLRAARESYERNPVGRDESSKYWRGLVNRWNRALETARGFVVAPPPPPPPPPPPQPSEPAMPNPPAGPTPPSTDRDAARAALIAALKAAANDPAVRAALASALTRLAGSGALASLGPLGIVVSVVMTGLWGFGQIGDTGLIGTPTATAVGASGAGAVVLSVHSALQRIASAFQALANRKE